MSVRLPLGKDIFPKLRKEGCYYIDKTGIIQKILDISFDVLLITRPRRFGKSLAMTMLEDFFDISRDSRADFEGLKVSNEKKLCGEWQNQWPVISLTLKDVEGLTFEDANGQLEILVSELCEKYAFLEKSECVNKNDKALFGKLAAQEANPQNLTRCMALLMRMMHAHYGKPAIVLIDEYDVPLAKADENGYYRKMQNVIRAVFAPLKSNPHLKFAVITGCLKIAKESIFTGTNNYIEDSILDGGYCLEEYFGFTEPEVDKLLADSGLAGHAQEIRDWYDGYLFGPAHVYCPWDVLNHVAALQRNPDAAPKNYWLNTSGNAIVKRLLQKAGRATRGEIGLLMEGESITKSVTDQVTYSEIEKSPSNLWSVLYLTGYLTKKDEAESGSSLALVIPNREIHDIFASHIMEWLTDTVTKKYREELDALCDALIKGSAQDAEDSFNRILGHGISVRDTATKGRQENFFHGLLLGLLLSADIDWIVESNAEDGDGYSDIHVEAECEDTAFLIEVKYAKNGKLETCCKSALEQINHKGYLDGLKESGFSKIYAYGIACWKKQCKVVCDPV